MNPSEIKLDLFRRIDGLPKAELEGFYEKVLALLSSTKEYKLSDAERHSVEEALEDHELNSLQTHENIVAEAKQKYPNLRFK